MAIETRMKEGSVDIESVGNGQMDSNRMAWTMNRVCGGVEIALHSSLLIPGVRTANKVTSCEYCRAATAMMAQNRSGDRE